MPPIRFTGSIRPSCAEIEAAGFTFDGENPGLRNPSDDHTLMVMNPAIRGHTDQIIYRFRKPG